ncbi:MAG: hypothetical protein M3298_06915, partial [Thermoproteota archaeon]|nr:hypothetical protein [Thermoproteota archaeon]
IIEISGLANVGLQIHLVSMVFFALMLWLRFYLSKRSGRKLIEDIKDYDRGCSKSGPDPRKPR